MRKSLLNKIKTRLKIGAVTALTPLILAFGSREVSAQLPIMDNFSIPQDSTSIYYSGMDADSNGVVNWEDYNLILQGVHNDLVDVNRDGIKGDQLDANMLAEYLNGNLLIPQKNWAWPNFPKQSREDWALKTSILDSTKVRHPEWSCGPLAINSLISLKGYSELKDSTVSKHFEKYDLENNGKFNLNASFISITSESGFPDGSHAHFVYSVLVGDNPLNFYDWVLIDPSYPNKIMSIGNLNLPNDSRISVNYLIFGKSGGISQIPYITFKSNQGIVEYISHLEDYVLTQRPKVNSIKPEKLNLLEKFVLNQNYPNPFNSSTTIKYSLPFDDKVTLNIYNLKGNLVETLVNEKQISGEYSVDLNASGLSSGIYLYRLSTSAGVNKTKKMTILK